MAAPAQTPAVQTSFVVHALLSEHEVPSAFAGFEQCPVDGSHVPAEWHWSSAAHVTAVPPQTPEVQTSPVVQAFPSEHDVPSAFAGFEHWPVERSQDPAE